MNVKAVREVETLAARAWPALEILDLDGWRLRWSAGYTRRANSVWPQHFGGSTPIEARLEVVESLYARRGVRPRYQLSASTEPASLPARLAERGYRREVETSVETVALGRWAKSLRRHPLGNIVVSGDHYPDERWWSVWTEVEGATPAARATAEAMLQRIPAPSLYAVAEQDGRPVSVGRAVLDGGWLGVFSVGTVGGARRQGAARGVMRWLAAWAEEGGAARAYLQVEVPNRPARRLFADAGFRPLYRYTYWSANGS